MTTLIDIVSLLHGYYEINKFKYEKAKGYYKTISMLTEVEFSNLETAHELLDKIMNNPNV